MSSAHQRFYSPCFINATELAGQPENASDAAVKGNRTDPIATDPPPLGCNDQTAYICKTSTFNFVLGH